MVANVGPPKCRAARLETIGPRAPRADPKQITKAITSHGAGVHEKARRLTMPRNVATKDAVAATRKPKRSAAHPDVMMPKIESRPAVPKADAAARGESPDCTRNGTTCVITEKVVIEVNAKSWTICQYSRVRTACMSAARAARGGVSVLAFEGLSPAMRRHGSRRSSGIRTSVATPIAV